MIDFAGSMRPLILALAALASLAAAAPRAGAASNFDGEWSVVIVTEAGNCDRAYRYPVTVTKGVLKYEGDAAIAISGRVDQSGKINATIRRGEQSASGSGRLSSVLGNGTWTGKSSTASCAGRWEAEKRTG